MIPPRITTRAEWDAHHGRGSLDSGPEGRVVIHHSYRPALDPDATVAQEMAAVHGIERHHVTVKEWDGIGYNFLVAPSGRLYEGRGWKYRGAHAGPVNGDSIGICLLIDGNTDDPTPEMMQAVRDLIGHGVELGEIAADYTISGHRDHMPRECPGDLVYARLDEFYHLHWPNTSADTAETVVWPEIPVGDPALVGTEWTPSPIEDLGPVERILSSDARAVVNTTAERGEPYGEMIRRHVEWLADQPETGAVLAAIARWAIRKLTARR